MVNTDVRESGEKENVVMKIFIYFYKLAIQLEVKMNCLIPECMKYTDQSFRLTSTQNAFTTPAIVQKKRKPYGLGAGEEAVNVFYEGFTHEALFQTTPPSVIYIPCDPRGKALLTGGETGLLGTVHVLTTGRRAHSFLAVPSPSLV